MRQRITAIAAAIVAVVLVAIAVVVVSAVRAELYDNLDRSLDQRAADVAASFVDGASPTIATSDLEDHFAQVVAVDGEVLAATTNAADLIEAWPRPDTTTVMTRTGLPIEDDVYRVLIRADKFEDAAIYVVVGENVDDLRDTIRELVVALFMVIPLALAVLAAAVWWLVGRTLRPVEAIRREVDEIALDELERRVPAPGTGDEVEQLAGTMNRMLERLQESATRQRRFAADASHELRTPLARLRTALEVEQAHPSDDPECLVDESLANVSEMQTLIDDLLFLARVDAGSAAPRRRPVDLDEVVAAEVRAAEGGTAITIDTSAVQPVVVRGDQGQLARLFRNLLSNATRFADERVEIALCESDKGIELSVADDGPGISTARRAEVFGRFVRGDEGRSDRHGGTGLGLSIAAEIADAHDGTIEIRDAVDLGGACLVVSLPDH